MLVKVKNIRLLSIPMVLGGFMEINRINNRANITSKELKYIPESNETEIINNGEKLLKELDKMSVINNVNISNKKVVIEKIDYTSKNIITNYDYIREIENISENYQEKISNIVNEEYDVYRKSIKSNCRIEGNEEVIKLFIPLTYIKENSVSTTGIIIRYLIDDVEYQQIIEPFVFFNTIENTVEVEKIVFNPCKV